MKNRNSKYERKSKKSSQDRKFQRPKFQGKDYNDQSWYNKNTQLTIDTASLPYNHSMTNVVELVTDDGTRHNTGLPMLMTMAHDWLIGDPSVITTAGRIIWADMRKVNSGATNYQSGDIIALITAIADTYITATWLSSFFGVGGYFNGRSRLMPKMLFASAGIDYDDFNSNIANYRGRLNLILLKMRTLNIPKKYPWIDAAMSLYGKLFKDEDTDTGREQLYWVNKACFHIYDPASATGTKIRQFMISDLNEDYYGNINVGGSNKIDATVSGSAAAFGYRLKDQEIDTPTITFGNYLDILDKMVMAIISDEDANIIQGDLMKAFGDTPAYTTSQLDANYEIKPTYSEEFGWYLHNATIYSSPMTKIAMKDQPGTFIAWTTGAIDTPTSETNSGYTNIIKQDPESNSFEVVLEYAGMNTTESMTAFSTVEPMMDTDKYNPSPEDNIWMSRGINAHWVNTSRPKVVSNGIIMNVISWRTVTMAASPWTVYVQGYPIVSFINDEALFAQQQAALSGYNWKPIQYYAERVSGYNYLIHVIG